MQMGNDPNCLEQCLARGLEVSNYAFSALRLEEPAPTAWHRMARMLVPGHAYGELNALLLDTVDELRPDVLWVFKGMSIYPRTVRALRGRGMTLVNYNADHPFRFFSRGSGNSNVSISIPYYHLHLTYSRRIGKELTERFPEVEVAIVPFGHEVSDAVYEQISGEREIVRACFLGNPDVHRKHQIEHLLKAGLAVDVYGHHWDRFLQPDPHLRMHGQVTGIDMLRTLRTYRVQLNFFRPHNVDLHNMRTFEVPACGGIMLAEDSAEHCEFFASGREAFFFRSPAQMIEGARHLLAMSRSDADAVRQAARARCTQAGYTYRDRSHQALAAISAVHAHRQTKASVSEGGKTRRY